MAHTLSKSILISQVTELIAKQYKIKIDDARDLFYQSKVVEMLNDDETGLYGESALYLFSLFQNEKNTSYFVHFIPSDY